MTIQSKKRTRGFGLVEVLISGVIIIIVLGALVVLARNAINNSQYVQERAQAVSLAQEGMEIVRQIRDSNYIDGDNETNWQTLDCSGPSNVLQDETDYYISYNLSSRFCLAGTRTAINLSGNDYYRTIRFTDIGSSGILKSPTDVSNAGANGVLVTVTVTWNSRTGTDSVEIKELLANSRFQF